MHATRTSQCCMQVFKSFFIAGGQPSVRLCDAALSKDLFPGDYHCLGDNDNRPVKWLSLDTLQSGQFAPSTDVWGWGVTMWEILTRWNFSRSFWSTLYNLYSYRAQQPFPDVDPFEMEGYLVDGFRLHQPVNCPDQLYTVSWSLLHFSPFRSGCFVPPPIWGVWYGWSGEQWLWIHCNIWLFGWHSFNLDPNLMDSSNYILSCLSLLKFFSNPFQFPGDGFLLGGKNYISNYLFL